MDGNWYIKQEFACLLARCEELSVGTYSNRICNCSTDFLTGRLVFASTVFLTHLVLRTHNKYSLRTEVYCVANILHIKTIFCYYIINYLHLTVTFLYFPIIFKSRFFLCVRRKRLPWSRGSVLAFGTQVRVFAPGQNRRIFRAKKILSTPSFRGEVKPSVPCRSFTACKRPLNVTWKSAFRQNSWTYLAHSSTFRHWVLSRGDTRGDAWWRKLKRLTQIAQ
jgi:hypothetical protein